MLRRSDGTLDIIRQPNAVRDRDLTAADGHRLVELGDAARRETGTQSALPVESTHGQTEYRFPTRTNSDIR